MCLASPVVKYPTEMFSIRTQSLEFCVFPPVRLNIDIHKKRMTSFVLMNNFKNVLNSFYFKIFWECMQRKTDHHIYM